MAITALAMSVVGFLSVVWCPALPLGFGAVAMVLGILSLRRIRRDPERLTGRGLAIAGAILGGLGVALCVFLAIVMGATIAYDS